MYVCMYVCLYVCMYVCVYIALYIILYMYVYYICVCVKINSTISQRRNAFSSRKSLASLLKWLSSSSCLCLGSSSKHAKDSALQ